MNKHIIKMAEDARDMEFWASGPELADAVLEVADKTEPIRISLYAKGLNHAHTPLWKWRRRRALDREVHNLLLEFFLAATKEPERPEYETYSAEAPPGA